MRRLARYTLNALTALSLLLCVATVALWVRSYYRSDVVKIVDTRASRTIASQLGQFWYLANPLGASSGPDSPPRWVAYSGSTTGGTKYLVEGFIAFGADFWVNILGLKIGLANGVEDRAVVAVIPCWTISLLFSLVPGAVLAATLRRRRRRNQTCVKCGYDLRATPDRCPECGTMPPCAASPATPSTP